MSEPGGTPKGWSGTVKVAGPVKTQGNNSSFHCYTDCSGFVTSLFTHANSITTAKLRTGKKDVQFLNDLHSKVVLIADEAGYEHTLYTRPVKVISVKEKTGAGLGMGLAKHSVSSNNILEFYWSLSIPSLEVGSVTLGRAL